MLTAISHRVRSVGAEEPQEKRSLRIIPIVGESHEQPEYRLLEPKILDRVLVTEVSDAGSVPVLKVHNALDQRVYLMDGQELRGAKQNRILNTDVMVPASGTIQVPVSCVERGRWRYISGNFSAGKAASYSVRQGKHGRVSRSLKAGHSYDADQSAVWDEVQHCLELSEATSGTEALADAYKARESDLTEYRSAIRLPDNAVGVAVFHAGEFRGIDLFDRHSTMKYFWNALLDSYAIETLGEPFDPKAPPAEPDRQAIGDAFAAAADGNWEAFDSPGEGRDHRLDTARFSASALVWEERVVVHLQIFPAADGSKAPTVRPPRVQRVY